MRTTIRLIGFALLMLSATSLFASSITATGTSTFSSGTGFGSVLSILSVQNTPTEWGGVAWNGTTDVLTGDAKTGAQTGTVTIADLIAAGGTASSFSVIFNVNQTGSNDSVQLPAFTLNFYSAAGALIATLSYTDPPPLFDYNVAGQGTGSSGYVFIVNLTGADANVFNNPTNRIGLVVPENNPITGSNDGQENFYVGPGNPTQVPEVSSVIMIGFGFLLLGVSFRKLFRKHAMN